MREDHPPLLLRALLRLYPRDFRERNGAELIDFLRRQRREARYAGAVVGAVRYWIDVGWDTVRNGIALRLRRVRSGHDGTGHGVEGTMRTTLEGTGTDARMALRGLVRSPGFTAAVVGMLALGIGSATAIFAVVDAVLLAPLPFVEPDRLVVVWQNDRATGTVREPAATADYFDFRERSRSFSELAMTRSLTAVMTADDAEPRRVTAARVTASLDDVLGVEPALGRGIADAEDRPGGPEEAVLSHRFWRDVLGAERAVLGGTLLIDDRTVEVVGVLPPGVEYPSGDTDLWLPIQASAATSARNPHDVRVVGRLAPAVGLEAARAEMDGIAAALEAEYPANTNRGAFVEPLTDVVRGDVRGTLLVLLGAVGVLLALACVNVANLLVARSAARRREAAVLAALGGGPGRLARRFVVEGVMVAAAAGALGVGFAWWAVSLAGAVVPADLPGVGEIGLGLPVLAFAVGVSALVAVGFSVVPLRGLWGLDLRSSLGTGARDGGDAGSLLARRMLVGGQVALAAVLLVGSALLLQTLKNLHGVDPGFEASNVLRVGFTLPESRYPRDFAVWPDWTEVNGFHRELVRRVDEIPGVRSSATTVNHPLDPGFTNGFGIEGREADPDRGEMTTRVVTPGYFATVGLGVLEGRAFTTSDDTGTEPVLVLNRTAAERHFPDGDALGAGIGLWGSGFRRVVGIVEDERVHGLREPAPPTMYVNIYQAPPRLVSEVLLVRTEGDPTAVTSAVRDVVRELDPGLALFDIGTLEATVAEAVARERFVSTVVTFFGVVAALLAMLGVNGVLSYLVTRRRHEMGVRLALGASRSDVVRLVAARGLAMAGAGLLVGLVAARLGGRVLEGILFGVEASDPFAYLGAALLLGVAALVAATAPALRAARTPPAACLRES